MVSARNALSAFYCRGEHVVTELPEWHFVMIAMKMPLMPNPAGGPPIDDPQPIIGANGIATLQNNPNKKILAI